MIIFKSTGEAGEDILGIGLSEADLNDMLANNKGFTFPLDDRPDIPLDGVIVFIGKNDDEMEKIVLGWGGPPAADSQP